GARRALQSGRDGLRADLQIAEHSSPPRLESVGAARRRRLHFPTRESDMMRPSTLLALIAVSSATCALAQTPPPSDDPTAPSAASSPHQRDSTSTNAAEATPAPGAEPSSASSPHQREVTEGSKMTKAVTPESFASQAAIIGKAEIELGQLAIKNTQDEKVRSYAERMVK